MLHQSVDQTNQHFLYTSAYMKAFKKKLSADGSMKGQHKVLSRQRMLQGRKADGTGESSCIVMTSRTTTIHGTKLCTRVQNSHA